MYRNLWDPELWESLVLNYTEFLNYKNELVSISRAQSNDVWKVTMHCNINQAIFLGHANHKQMKTSLIFCLLALKQVYGIIVGGRGPKSSKD